MITVRPSTPEDLAFIKEMMWEVCVASPLLLRERGPEELKQSQERYWNDWIGKNRPGFIALDENGQKLGALTLRPYPDWRRELPTWELGIGVVEWARRRGVGQALMQSALDFCRETDQPYLILTVDPVNRSAQALYRKMGFKITSKRHGVIEMRYSFTPPSPEDPEIVAKRRYFLQYEPKAQYYGSRYKRHHSSPYHVAHPQFRKRGLKSDDWVYIITVVEGKLHLVVKYEVEKVMSYEEARAEFAPDYKIDPKADHLLTAEATLYSFEPPIDLEVTQALRLLEKGQAKPLPFEDEALLNLNPNKLRGVREITCESAELLDGFVEQFRRREY
jgi:RimJ/RimL family protein N-acetyltransferase